MLGALPLLVRAVQSVKRWVDSGLGTHLINVSCVLFFLVEFGCGG